jgi:hypothetical protein
MSVEVREALAGDAESLGLKLSPTDRLESWLATGRPPEEALRRSVEQSRLCWSIFLDGELVAMIGAGITEVPELGIPWMLSSQKITNRPLSIVRKLTWCRDKILAVFPRLINFVYAENQTAVRLIKGLGFNVAAQPEPYGWCGAPFYRFHMEVANVLG